MGPQASLDFNKADFNKIKYDINTLAGALLHALILQGRVMNYEVRDVMEHGTGRPCICMTNRISDARRIARQYGYDIKYISTSSHVGYYTLV